MGNVIPRFQILCRGMLVQLHNLLGNGQAFKDFRRIIGAAGGEQIPFMYHCFFGLEIIYMYDSRICFDFFNIGIRFIITD